MRRADALLGCLAALSFSCADGAAGPPESDAVKAAASSRLVQAVGSPGMGQQGVEQILLQNERKIWDAFKARDVNSLGALLAEELLVVSDEGRFSKSEFLRRVAHFPDIPSYSLQGARVIWPSPDVAIVTYESRYTAHTPRPVTYSAYQTTVWANRGGRWLAVFNQETQTPSRR